MSPKIVNGSCLCGCVRYAVDDSFEYAMNCHCSQCRRATGSAFKCFAGIPADRLKIVQGASKTMIHGEPAADHDVRCAACGSLLYSIVRGGAYAHVTMGTMLSAPAIRPSMHIFVGSKAPWHEITDSLPQHDTLPGNGDRGADPEAP
jgi:hypothetical protein